MSKDYKTEQQLYRKLTKATRTLWQGGTLNMGIRKFKRTMSDKAIVRQYKQYAWGSITEKKGGQDGQGNTKRS